MLSRDDVVRSLKANSVTLQSICIVELCAHLCGNYSMEDSIDVALSWPRPVTKGLRESLLQKFASDANLTWQGLEHLLSSDVSTVDIGGATCFPIPRYRMQSYSWQFVETLNVSRVNSLSVSDISQFSQMFPNITDLNISHNPQLTDTSILCIALSLDYRKSLTSLDISGVPLLKAESIDSLSNLHVLRSMRMAYCLDKTANWSSCTLCSWPVSHLTVLDCSGFLGLATSSTLSQQLPSLRELRLSESDFVNTIVCSEDSTTLHLPLILLDISWCEDVDTSSLESLFPHTPSLEVAVLRGTNCNSQTVISIALNCSR